MIRYNFARDVCEAILDLLESMNEDKRQQLLDFVALTKLTAVMEILSPKHQHVEDFSHLKTDLVT